MRERPDKFADNTVAVRSVITIFGGVWADVGAQYSPPGKSLVKAWFWFMLVTIPPLQYTI